MKKILLLSALLIFVSQSFGQTSEKLKISYEKNRSGQESYYVSKIVTKQNISSIGQGSVKKTTTEYILDIDTLHLIDKIIPEEKQLEAYSKGVTTWDTTKSLDIYYAKDFWLSKSHQSEYKLARLDEVKKEIRFSTANIILPNQFASDILILAIIIVVISILLCSGFFLDEDRSTMLIGIITFLGYIAMIVVIALNATWNHAVITVPAVIISMMILGVTVKTWTSGDWEEISSILFAIVIQLMVSILIGVYTSSWWAFLATIGLAVVTWLVFWLMVVIFSFIFEGGLLATIRFVSRIIRWVIKKCLPTKKRRG